MKLSQILNEGIVKVPETTLRSILAFTVGVYFSHLLLTYKKYDKKPPLDYKRALKRATDRYGRFNIYDDIEPTTWLEQKFKYPISELPKNYKKGLRRDYKILVLVGADSDTNQGLYHQKSKGRAGRIEINIRRGVNLMAAMNDPKVIDAQLTNLAGTVEHELMHATQDIALRGVDSSLFHIDYYDEQGKVDTEKHSMNAVEFSPLIKSASAAFKQTIELVQTKGDVTKANLQDYLKAFVNPNAPSPFHGGQHITYPFFNTLYKKDRHKWKKAVKYLHSLLSDYINEFN